MTKKMSGDVLETGMRTLSEREMAGAVGGVVRGIIIMPPEQGENSPSGCCINGCLVADDCYD